MNALREKTSRARRYSSVCNVRYRLNEGRLEAATLHETTVRTGVRGGLLPTRRRRSCSGLR